jgi:hypothetical protein
MPDVIQQLQAATDQEQAGIVPQDFGADFEKLPKDRIRELQTIVSMCGQRDQWGRMVEIIRCTLRRYFWLGIQHGFWNADLQQMQIGPNGGSLENLNEEDLFNGDFNIFTQNGKIFMAVFSQNGAGSRMEPDKPGDPDSVKAAEEAEKYLKVYEKYNPPKVAQMAVAQLLYTDGRVIAVTRTQPDEKLGTNEDGEGNPVPREAELTEYFGVLETKVPLIGKFSEWPYCCVSIDKDILVAKDENPNFASALQANARGSVPNFEVARMSRVAVSENIRGLSADTLAYMATEDTWWLRPAAFRNLPDESVAFWIGPQGIFKQGCRVKFFGTVFCGAAAVSMSDEVQCMHAMPGQGNSRPSLSDPMIPAQMETNDAAGLYSEMLHKCVPSTWVNCSVEDLAAILAQSSKFGDYHPASFAQGQPMTNFFFNEAFPEMPAGFEKWMDWVSATFPQFATGNSPAMFGQQMEDQKTATGYAQARDQSLGLMALVWVPYLEFRASICGQAARQAANRDTDTISAVVPDDRGGVQDLSIKTAVMKRGFLCAPITDQNFPESWTERSNKMQTIVAAAPTNPWAAKLMSEPDNQRIAKDAIGLDDLVIPGADSSELQLAEWAKMQENELGPVEDQQATQQRDQQKQQQAQQAISTIAPGQQAPPLPVEPPVMTSSVPISINTDDHIVHAMECFRILNSPEGQKIKEKAPQVWADLEQHMMEHEAAAQAKGMILPPPLGSGLPPMPPPIPGPGGPAKPPLGASPDEGSA